MPAPKRPRQFWSNLTASRTARKVESHDSEHSPTDSFYAIHRTDGELIDDEVEWVKVAGPDDWDVAEDDSHTGDFTSAEYEIVHMTVTPVARRTFGQPDEEE